MPRRSNCLFFALAVWWRRGGYLAVRPLRHLNGWCCHWLVRHPKFDRWLAYEPFEYYDSWWREALAKFWYAGKIVRDDRQR